MSKAPAEAALADTSPMACYSRAALALGFVLVAVVSPDVADARLLSAGRKPGALVFPTNLSAEMDLPVFHLLREQQARVGAWALKGTPTHYEATGCKKVKKVYHEVQNSYGSSSMSVSRCFAFCGKRKGLSYFGLTGGNECWCGAAIDATPMDASHCDTPCPGYAMDMCGGIVGTSVYQMIDCTKATKEEIAQEKAEKTKALLSSYGSFSDETCGQDKDNVVKLDNKGFISGKVDTCKLACWNAKGADVCHGFTYDEITSKCTFHYDVTAGPVTKNPKAACYFKMP